MASGGRIAVGVDTGKRGHRAAAYDAAVACWLGEVSFPVSRVGFDRFVAFLDRLTPVAGAIVVGLEATGHYHLTLAEHLAAAGYPVAVLDPYRASQFRRSEGHTAKTDRLDARALAALRELTRLRADLVADRATALTPRVARVLDRHHRYVRQLRRWPRPA